jgi:hypothetical protein
LKCLSFTIVLKYLSLNTILKLFVIKIVCRFESINLFADHPDELGRVRITSGQETESDGGDLKFVLKKI